MSEETPKPAPTVEDAIPITETLQNAATSVEESIKSVIPGAVTEEEKEEDNSQGVGPPIESFQESSTDVGSPGDSQSQSVSSTDDSSQGVGPSVETPEAMFAPVEDTFDNSASTSTSTGTKKKRKKRKKCKCPTKKQKASKKKYPRCKRGRRSPKTKKCKGARKCDNGYKNNPSTGVCVPK